METEELYWLTKLHTLLNREWPKAPFFNQSLNKIHLIRATAVEASVDPQAKWTTRLSAANFLSRTRAAPTARDALSLMVPLTWGNNLAKGHSCRTQVCPPLQWVWWECQHIWEWTWCLLWTITWAWMEGKLQSSTHRSISIKVEWNRFNKCTTLWVCQWAHTAEWARRASCLVTQICLLEWLHTKECILTTWTVPSPKDLTWCQGLHSILRAFSKLLP